MHTSMGALRSMRAQLGIAVDSAFKGTVLDDNFAAFFPLVKPRLKGLESFLLQQPIADAFLFFVEVSCRRCFSLFEFDNVMAFGPTVYFTWKTVLLR